MRLSSSTAARSPFASQAGMLAQGALFPKLSIRPAGAVIGWSARQSAEWELARDFGNLEAAEKNFTAARANLGAANRSKRLMRRHRQADAMRLLNARRGQVCRARKALAASQAALTALAGAGV